MKLKRCSPIALVERSPRRRIEWSWIGILGVFLSGISGQAQLMVDTTFKARVCQHGEVRALAMQPDGKIVIAGEFTEVDAVPRKGLARLNPDGRLDHSFQPPANLDGTITALHVQTNGIILAGGSFPTDRTNPNGSPEFDAFRRFQPSGAPDTRFHPISRNGPFPSDIALIPDSPGRCFELHNFEYFHSGVFSVGYSVSRRHEEDDRIDLLAITDERLSAGCRLDDGALIIAGRFQEVRDPSNRAFPRNLIAKLSPAGEVVAGFAPQFSGLSVPEITCLAATSTGRIFAGGRFDLVNGKPRPGIVRLLADGTVDTAFDPTKGPGFKAGALNGIGNGVAATGVWPQPDGKVLVAGWFGDLQDYRLIRLLASGGVDATWVLPSDYTTKHKTLTPFNQVVPITGGLLIGGLLDFNQGGGTALLKVSMAGAVDTNFTARVERPGGVTALEPQRDGKILLGGAFTSINGTPRANLGRINPDGSLDTTFADGKVTGRISRILAGADGKVWVGGDFPTAGGAARRSFARFHTNGTLDTAFFARMDPQTRVADIALTADGKLVACGDLLAVGSARAQVVRFRVDGVVDTSFKPGDIWTSVGLSQVSALAVQSDGRVIVGGTFTTVGTIGRTNLARLLPTGQSDPTFNAGVFAHEWGSLTSVEQVRLDPRNRVFISGFFTHLQSQPRPHFACLTQDGTLEGGFALVLSAGSQPNLDVNQEGACVVGDRFADSITAFRSDGTIGYRGVGDAPDGCTGVALTDSGEIIVARNFGQSESSTNGGIARLVAEPARPTILVPPVPAIVQAGEPLTLEVEARGAEPLQDAWFRNGIRLPEQSSRRLHIPVAARSHAGSYRIEVTDFRFQSATAEAGVLVLPGVIPVLSPATEPGTYWIVGHADDDAAMTLGEIDQFLVESTANLQDWEIWSTSWLPDGQGSARSLAVVTPTSATTFFRIRRK